MVRRRTAPKPLPQSHLYLKVAIQLSYFTSCCQLLTERGIVEALCRTAGLCAAGDRRIALSELLWNLLALVPPRLPSVPIAPSFRRYQVF